MTYRIVTCAAAVTDAAEHIRNHPPADCDQAHMDSLIDIMTAPYAERVRKQIREILTNDALTVAEKSTALADAVDRLALTPPPDPQPLPLIDEDDIHLICWMAIAPS